jgi:hypothetical protein
MSGSRKIGFFSWLPEGGWCVTGIKPAGLAAAHAECHASAILGVDIPIHFLR